MSDAKVSMRFRGYTTAGRDEVLNTLRTFEDWTVSAQSYWDWRNFRFLWAVVIENMTPEQSQHFINAAEKVGMKVRVIDG